jgi:hypothetical protein
LRVRGKQSKGISNLKGKAVQEKTIQEKKQSKKKQFKRKKNLMERAVERKNELKGIV